MARLYTSRRWNDSTSRYRPSRQNVAANTPFLSSKFFVHLHVAVHVDVHEHVNVNVNVVPPPSTQAISGINRPASTAW
jgi:hypothetical protein